MARDTLSAAQMSTENPERMSFARKVWHLIVAVKDGLSLAFLLLFFFALYAILTARPSPAAVREGALLLQLDGTIVEEKSQPGLLNTLISGKAPAGEYDVQELVHAIDAAAKDERIKAVRPTRRSTAHIRLPTVSVGCAHD